MQRPDDFLIIPYANDRGNGSCCFARAVEQEVTNGRQICSFAFVAGSFKIHNPRLQLLVHNDVFGGFAEFSVV